MAGDAKAAERSAGALRATLWAAGMPTPGLGQHWRHEGGSFYVDVTDRYVPVPDERAIERAARVLCPVPWDEVVDDEACRDLYLRKARAVLAAALEQPDA